MENAEKTEKFDVLRGRLLGNHNDFHWQLGGQINHQSCSCKAARVIRCTELDSAVSSFSVMISESGSTTKNVKLFGYDFRGHTRSRDSIWLSFVDSIWPFPCSRDSIWLSLLQGSSDFFTCFFKYHK